MPSEQKKRLRGDGFGRPSLWTESISRWRKLAHREEENWGALAHSLDSIFRDHYAIPEFQRPYVWKRKHILQLFDDTHAAYTERGRERLLHRELGRIPRARWAAQPRRRSATHHHAGSVELRLPRQNPRTQSNDGYEVLRRLGPRRYRRQGRSGLKARTPSSRRRRLLPRRGRSSRLRGWSASRQRGDRELRCPQRARGLPWPPIGGTSDDYRKLLTYAVRRQRDATPFTASLRLPGQTRPLSLHAPS
jgi:hypothetical protein